MATAQTTTTAYTKRLPRLEKKTTETNPPEDQKKLYLSFSIKNHKKEHLGIKNLKTPKGTFQLLHRFLSQKLTSRHIGTPAAKPQNAPQKPQSKETPEKLYIRIPLERMLRLKRLRDSSEEV